jgi:hypothetical protein
MLSVARVLIILIVLIKIFYYCAFRFKTAYSPPMVGILDPTTRTPNHNSTDDEL